jgi:RNA polymerase sigma factor (sigma-70 family)
MSGDDRRGSGAGGGRREGARVRAVAPEAERASARESASDLVGRMAAGDRGALAELYARESAALFAYLRLFTVDRELSEEIVQDTFLAAWHGAAAFAGRATVRSWLFAIARRRAADALRRPRLRAVPEDAAGLSELPSREPGPEDLAIAAATREELTAALARLSPVHREALELAFGHGLSYPELSEVLGIPLGTVKSRLSYAKRALRRLLDEAADAAPGGEGRTTR